MYNSNSRSLIHWSLVYFSMEFIFPLSKMASLQLLHSLQISYSTTHHILGCWVCLLLHEWKGSNEIVIFFILHTDERLSVFTLFTGQQHRCSHPKPSLPVELWVPSFLPSQDQFLQGQSHQRKKHFHISLFIKWKNFLSYILLQPTLIFSALLHIKTFHIVILDASTFSTPIPPAHQDCLCQG